MLLFKVPKIRIIFFLFYILSTQASAGTDKCSLLEQYVISNDNKFSYQPISSISLTGVTAHIYKMISQEWRTKSEINRTSWEHQVTVIVPDNLTSEKAILFIFGGKNTPDFLIPDTARLKTLATFANLTGSIAIQVNQVPNQPLTFLDEPDANRSEDDLVAYSFDTAMGSNDYSWVAYLPMAKAVVKTMDAVQMIADDLDLPKKPKDFVLVGFSKRGAITWLTAAVDHRVYAISPGVYDAINFAPSLENHRKTYGVFNEVLKDYDERNILDRLRTHEGQQLINIVDPYTYRDHITIPKYIINTTGDQFYTPDSSLFYINSLQGETLLRYVPNTDHSGSNGGYDDAFQGLLAWYQRIVNEKPRPEIKWKLDLNNNLSVNISDITATALLWSAYNKTAKDFRLESFGPNWHATPVEVSPEGKIDIPLFEPESGWSGYFVEISIQGISGIMEKYTTPVIILPTTEAYSLQQPILSPKSKSVWIATLADIISGTTKNSELINSFPIRNIGDEVLLTINDANTLLTTNTKDKKILAQQECLVTRLNIKDKQLDWYSIPFNNGYFGLWQWWNYADHFYRDRLYSISEYICARINL